MMAAQVEVQTGEVGRTVAGGRLHLSPLTDSSNKSLIEIPSINQSSIITSEPTKPVPGPKPRLTPKPFAVEKNPTIKPILAPKPQTKTRPESTRLAGYKPELPSSPKPQQPAAAGKPRPLSTNPNRPAPTTYKTSNKLNTGQTTKPVVQPFKPAPLLEPEDPSKPIPPVPAERQKSASSCFSKSFKKPAAAEWSGTTKIEDEKGQKTQSKGGTSITRAKSMGFLVQVGQEDEGKEKAQPEVSVLLRNQSRGSRPRPVSAIFPGSPTKTETPVPAPRWVGRRPLSADLTSKFESLGLSLHRKSPKANTKENNPEEKALPQKKGQDKTPGSTTTQSSDDIAIPAILDQSTTKTEESAVKETDEEKRGVSIKSRISLLLDSSSSPVVGATSQGSDPHSPVQLVHEMEPQVGVKQLIKQLTEDSTPTQSPVMKPVLKPRPLPLDLTKRFSSERSPDLVSLTEAADRHEISKDQRRTEEPAVTPNDQKTILDLKDSQELFKKASVPEEPEAGKTSGTASKESGPAGQVQTVRASLFENVVEKHSILMMDDEGKSENTDKGSLSSPSFDKRRDPEDDGTLVTAIYKEPVSPSSPLWVLHAFETVQAVAENRAVSESVPSAQWEDKAMTLRSRRSEVSRPTIERTSPSQGQPVTTTMSEAEPRYLRVGALQKWTTTGFDQDLSMEKGILAESQKEGVALDKSIDGQDEEATATKCLKTLQTEGQTKPRATYFALTGQIQEPASPGDVGTSFRDMTLPVDDSSLRSALNGSQGKILPIRRNPSLDEAFGKSSQEHVEELIVKGHVSPREIRSPLDRQTKEEMKEVEKKKERQRAKMKELEREKQRQLEMEKQAHIEFARMKEREIQREYERQRQKAFEKEKQELEEKQRALERQKQIELEKERLQELEKEKQRERERVEKQRALERQKQMELEKQKVQELEREKQKELERIEKQRALERQKQTELEKQKLQEFEKEKQREFERERQRQLEREKQELERQREIEKLQERERQREKERQRQREEERQRELDKERRLLEIQKEKQKMEELERIKEIERQQLLEFQKQKLKEKERQQLIELEKQRLREKIEREEAEKIRKMALEQEMLRMKELDKERERQREMEREYQKEIEREKQRELEKQRQRDLERQRQLDFEKQELENQRLRQRELEKERQRKEELEILKEMERRQLLEFEKQKQAERNRQQILEFEKRRLREKLETEEAEKMRHLAKQQEAERQRIKEKQRREEQERLKLETSPLRPKVVDLDSVLRNDQLSKTTSPRSDPATRWKEPYKPAILDIDSFTSQAPQSPGKDFPLSSIQGLDAEIGAKLQPTPERDVSWKVPAQTSVGFSSPVWTTSPQDPWELRPVEMSVDNPIVEPRKHTNKVIPEQLLLKQGEQLVAPQRPRSALLEQSLFMAPFSGTEAKTNSPSGLFSTTTAEQIWLLREPQAPGSRGEAQSHRRSQGSQELNRMRSRSVSRRSAPSSSAVEGSLSRLRSRSAHRERDRHSWVQQKQSVSGEEEGKDSTPVRETDSQYGTWETGLRTDDSLTPATPSSESNLSPSPRKPSPPHTPGDQVSHFESDTLDGLPPSSSSENQTFSFPDAPTTLLDSSALRSRAQLGKKRAPRTRPTRAARQSAAQAEKEGGTTEDWLYRDSTEAKAESKDDDSDSEEQPRGSDASPAVASQPQRIALFPGMDPSALKAQLKKRGDSDNQIDGSTPSPSQLSRSPKSPFLPRAARVLPPPGGKENCEEDSPQWLKELKSKKRLSQYENES